VRVIDLPIQYNYFEKEFIMPQVPLRETVFDAACLMVGKMGKLSRFRLKQPIIIVGTGRCGTNLLVDILNSHTGISGFPGEANELWHPELEPYESASIDIPPIEINPKRFTEISIENWHAGHGERISDTFAGYHLLRGNSKFFFTKSAMISFMIPKIMELFPDAKIIHLYRTGLSVVESYFKKNFGKYSRYKYPEKDYRLYCANYWNDCILEIEKRKTELGLAEKGQFLEFSYEDLCQTPNDILSGVADYIGVKKTGFGFNLAEIASQNYKAAKSAANPETAELITAMSPGLKLKGYI
jgi:hypothetical protein